MRMSTLFRYSYPLHVFHEITSMNFNDTYETSFYPTSKAGQITKKGPLKKVALAKLVIVFCNDG